MSRPQLDYFIGRVVERTSKTKDSHKIYLEHGVVIHSTRQLPDGLKGKKLQTIIYGETDTTLVFDGGIKVDLHPTNYMLETTDFKPFNPQTPEELEHLRSQETPPDPSEERVNDDPSPQLEKNQEAKEEAERAAKAQEAQAEGMGPSGVDDAVEDE